MKKVLILLFALVLVLVGVGCNDTKEPDEPEDVIDYDKVNTIVDTIDFLFSKGEDLDFSKESVVNDINKVKTDYESLNKSEKELITNYENFEQVLNLYETYKKAQEEIEAEKQKKIDAVNEALEVVKKAIPNTCGTKDLELPNKYTSKEGVTVYIGWTTSDVKTIKTNGVVIQPRGNNPVKVKLTANVRCEKILEKYSKTVSVVPVRFTQLPKHPVFAYYYGNQIALSEIEAETIDVINLSFGDISDHGEVSVAGLNGDVVLQEREKGLRVVFSVQDKKGFQDWTSTPEKREILATNFVKTVEENHYDGVDIDWEYPIGQEVYNYTEFLKLLNTKLKAKNREYLLTSAVYGGKGSQHYNIKESVKYLDYVHLMTYDLNSSEITSHLTALGGSNPGINTGKGTVQHYNGAGVPKDKLVIGGACYGKVYNLPKDSTTFLGVKPTEDPKTINYSSIKANYLSKIGKNDPKIDVVRKWDSVANAPYLEVTEYNDDKTVKAKKFITYDDAESMKLKAEYVFSEGIAGMMFWELGGCDRTDNDLVGAINSVFSKH